MMSTPTKITVDIYRLAHHLRVAREGYALSLNALQNDGFKEEHAQVQLFFDLINECTELADALTECDHITFSNNPETDYPVINIYQLENK